MILASGTRARLLAAAVAGMAVAPAVGHADTLGLTSARLTTLATCSLTAYPASASIVGDSYVDEKRSGQVNGIATTMLVQSWVGHNQRAYLQFDLTKCITAPPATAVVRGAWLRLLSAALPATCEVYDVFAVSSAWNAATITWLNQPNPPGTALNAPPSSQRASSSNAGTPATCVNHTAGAYVVWDVTTDVAGFIAGSKTNNGWMVRDDVENNATQTQASFVASDANLANVAPQLTVSYTLP
jgi:hypothetical protein